MKEKKGNENDVEALEPATLQTNLNIGFKSRFTCIKTSDTYPIQTTFTFFGVDIFGFLLYFDRLIRSRRSKIKKNDTKSSFDAHRQLHASHSVERLCVERLSSSLLFFFSFSDFIITERNYLFRVLSTLSYTHKNLHWASLLLLSLLLCTACAAALYGTHQILHPFSTFLSLS